MVALLSVFDVVVAVAVGVAAVLAPATLVWIFAFGATADWSALWPTTATVWQLGHSVPVPVTIPGEYLAATGISQEAATFVLSLAPLAFAGFTAIFAARSGARASRAGAWITGVVTGTVVWALLAALLALTSQNSVTTVSVLLAVLLPTLWFAVPCLAGAVVTQWREADQGAVARLREWTEDLPPGWEAMPAAAVRGAALVSVGLIGAGAALVAIALLLRGGEVVALYQAGNTDVIGAIVVTLGEVAYLPTVIGWAVAFIAGPGISLGEGTAVSAAATQVGVIPPVPLLGIVPEQATQWLLLLALIPVGLGALAGWAIRPAVSEPADRASELDTSSVVRAATALAVAGLAAFSAALIAALTSGSIGPGTLASIGPSPGPVALTVGLEVLLGASILLLAPSVIRAETRSGTPSGLPSTGAADPGQ